MKIIETSKAVYEVAPSLFKPEHVFEVVRISKRTNKKRFFQAFKHQVKYWEKVSL